MQHSGVVFTDKNEGAKRRTFSKFNKDGILEVPKREGAFYINKKYDGVAYIDHKTKARKFHMDKIEQVFNPNRHAPQTVADALIDPNITIRHEKALPTKEPGYKELQKRDTIRHDAKTRVIHDYTGTPMIKVDQEGGIFDQQLKQGNYRTLSPQLAESGRQQTLAKTTTYADRKMKDGLSATNHPRRQSMGQPGKTRDLTGALLSKGKGVTDIDSTISKRGLMQRKLYLMKLMLRNERQANQLMKQKVGSLNTELHKNATAVRLLDTTAATHV